VADIAAGGSIGAGVGGIAGGLSGLSEPIKKDPGAPPKPKWYDPFKRFRPGAGEHEGGHVDYGSTLSRFAPGDEDIAGEDWKHHEEHHEVGEAFQKGAVSRSELESRRALQKHFARSKRIFKRGAIGAGIGAAVLGAPFLKKPFPSGRGRESVGKKTGVQLGAQAELLAGWIAVIATKHPAGCIGGIVTGVAAGAHLGGRFGGAIGARTKRRGKYAPTTKELSARLDDIIALK
jgi:hypothetical protein